jgi:hypothetical protein
MYTLPPTHLTDIDLAGAYMATMALNVPLAPTPSLAPSRIVIAPLLPRLRLREKPLSKPSAHVRLCRQPLWGGLDDRVQLGDLSGEIYPKRKGDDDSEELESPALPDLRKSSPMRRHALGFVGTANPVRLFMYPLLFSPCVVSRQQMATIPRLHSFLHRWTEPAFPLLISFHLVVLSV